MNRIVLLFKRMTYFAPAIILLMLPACPIAEHSNNQHSSYSKILSETLLEKLLYNPEVINNLSFLMDGENKLNNGDLTYNRDLTFYIRPQFIEDTASYDISNAELYVSDYQGEIFLDHEGEMTTKLRDFSRFDIDERVFFQSFRSIQSNYIVLSENQSIQELKPNGILISFYKPHKTANSVYQLIKLTNIKESRKSMLTVSFRIDNMAWRSWSLYNS